MKRAYRILIASLIIMLITGDVQAQTVNAFGIGVRSTPDGAGLVARFLLNNNIVIEGQLNGSSGNSYMTNDGSSVTIVGLAEYQYVFANPSWRVFAGPGFHFGNWDRYNDGYDYYRGTQSIYGVDAIFGAEYVFKRFPIGLSADVKPAVNFAADQVFFPNNLFGLSARYYIGNVMARQRKSMKKAASQDQD